MSNIYYGIVVKWVSDKGFGYIRYYDKGEEKTIYVHNSCTNKRRLYKGMSVRFSIGENDRGPIAENVEVISAKTQKDTGRENE